MQMRRARKQVRNAIQNAPLDVHTASLVCTWLLDARVAFARTLALYNSATPTDAGAVDVWHKAEKELAELHTLWIKTLNDLREHIYSNCRTTELTSLVTETIKLTGGDGGLCSGAIDLRLNMMKRRLKVFDDAAQAPTRSGTISRPGWVRDEGQRPASPRVVTDPRARRFRS